MSDTNVIVEKQDLIGLLTLNRPAEMNTFNVPFARELNDALWEMDRDPEVRVVVHPMQGHALSDGVLDVAFPPSCASCGDPGGWQAFLRWYLPSRIQGQNQQRLP